MAERETLSRNCKRSQMLDLVDKDFKASIIDIL